MISATTEWMKPGIGLRRAHISSRRSFISSIGMVCALLCALLLYRTASAQVVYHAGSQAAATSVSHAASGTNRLAIACMSWLDDTATISGMTSNSVAMTQIGSTIVHPDLGKLRAAAFYITAPSTGSVSYAATLSNTPLASYIQVMTFTGVDQTTPLGTHAANNSSGDVTAVSSTVSSAANDLVADCLYAVGTSATVGASQTARLAASDWGGYGMQTRTSTEPGAASVAMTWTLGSIGKWAQFAMPIRAAASNLYDWDDDTPYAYVDPAKTASGTGTLGDPYNPTQAMSLTAGTADRVIVWLPGTLNITGLNPSADKLPYLTPVNSGTSTARIIHKAQYTNSDASSGQRTYINRTANSGTIFGALNVNYIIWDGFWSSTSGIQGNPATASGEISTAGFWNTTGSKLVRCRLDAGNAFFGGGNHAVVFFEQASDIEIADNYLTNIGNSLNAAFGNNPIVMTYNAASVSFHHNTVVGPGGSGYYVKGQYLDKTPLVGTHRVHHNLFSNLGAGVVVGSPTQSNFSDWVWVYQNVVRDSEWGMIIRSFNAGQPYGIAYVNNTLANGVTYQGSYSVAHAGLGVIASNDAPASFTNGAIQIRNNIFYNFNKMVFQHMELTEDNITWDRNGYNTFTHFRQISEGGATSNFAAWQAETPSRDPNGLTASPLFENATGNDFRLQSSSTYRGAGTDYLNLLGGGTSAAINLGAYITSDMSDVMGRRN